MPSKKKAFVTKTSKRRIHPENCPPTLASALLRDIKEAKKHGKKPPYRYGNCAVPSAEYALRYGSTGAEFSGKVTSRAKGVERPATFGGLNRVISWFSSGTGSWVDHWY